jgi:hypothetical protein
MYRLSDVIREHDRKDMLGIKLHEVEILSHWDEIVGFEIAENTAPHRIQNGTLLIKTKSPAWAHELRAISETIKNKINAVAGQKVIKEIRFFHSDFNKGKNFDNSVEIPDIAAVDLGDEERAVINTIVHPLTDDTLKMSVIRIVTMNKKLNKWRSENGWIVCDRCSSMFLDGEKCSYCG